MTTDRNPPYDPTDSNPDPITQESGAHPIGTGLGAAYTGAIATAVGGAFGGPVGAVVGAAIGAVSGGLLGKAAAEAVNPTVEDEYWRANYATRPYVRPEHRYEDYEPAYQTGYEGYRRHVETGRRYDEVEPELQADYERRHAGRGMAWENAKHATRDAWDRAHNTFSQRNRPVDERPLHPQENVKAYDERVIDERYQERTREIENQKEIERDRIEAEERAHRDLVQAEPPIVERDPNHPTNRI